MGDVIIETYASYSSDTVRATANTYSLGANLENLTFAGVGNFSGTGNELSNQIVGGNGDDTLDGGVSGFDTLTGGAGNDTYLVYVAQNFWNPGIVENANAGIDTIVYRGHTDQNLALSENVERAVFDGAAGIRIKGNGLDNQIATGNGADRIDGGAGSDTMTGGEGDDDYFVDNVGDVVIETVGGGLDRVTSSLADYTLGANVENLRLGEYDSADLNGTGNELDNSIAGNNGDNVIDGRAATTRLMAAKEGTTLLTGARVTTGSQLTGVKTRYEAALEMTISPYISMTMWPSLAHSSMVVPATTRLTLTWATIPFSEAKAMTRSVAVVETTR